MLKKFLIAIGILVVLFVIGGFVLPTEYAIAREITIDAKPAAIHTYVGDLQRWDEWAPWKENDPTVQVSYGEKTTGVGASQTWTSEEGEGRLEFTKCDETGIAYDMNMMDLTSTSSMTYETVGDKTKVQWRMNGDFDIPVVGPYLRMMVQGAIGDVFDQGLNKLKTVAEQGEQQK